MAEFEIEAKVKPTIDEREKRKVQDELDSMSGSASLGLDADGGSGGDSGGIGLRRTNDLLRDISDTLDGIRNSLIAIGTGGIEVARRSGRKQPDTLMQMGKVEAISLTKAQQFLGKDLSHTAQSEEVDELRKKIKGAIHQATDEIGASDEGEPRLSKMVNRRMGDFREWFVQKAIDADVMAGKAILRIGEKLNDLADRFTDFITNISDVLGEKLNDLADRFTDLITNMSDALGDDGDPPFGGALPPGDGGDGGGGTGFPFSDEGPEGRTGRRQSGTPGRDLTRDPTPLPSGEDVFEWVDELEEVSNDLNDLPGPDVDTDEEDIMDTIKSEFDDLGLGDKSDPLGVKEDDDGDDDDNITLQDTGFIDFYNGPSASEFIDEDRAQTDTLFALAGLGSRMNEHLQDVAKWTKRTAFAVIDTSNAMLKTLIKVGTLLAGGLSLPAIGAGALLKGGALVLGGASLLALQDFTDSMSVLEDRFDTFKSAVNSFEETPVESMGQLMALTFKQTVDPTGIGEGMARKLNSAFDFLPIKANEVIEPIASTDIVQGQVDLWSQSTIEVVKTLKDFNDDVIDASPDLKSVAKTLEDLSSMEDPLIGGGSGISGTVEDLKSISDMEQPIMSDPFGDAVSDLTDFAGDDAKLASGFSDSVDQLDNISLPDGPSIKVDPLPSGTRSLLETLGVVESEGGTFAGTGVGVGQARNLGATTDEVRNLMGGGQQQGLEGLFREQFEAFADFSLDLDLIPEIDVDPDEIADNLEQMVEDELDEAIAEIESKFDVNI